MLGTKIYKNDFDEELYLQCSKWANENGCVMAVHDDYYEVEETTYDLTEEKEMALQMLYTKYKRELANTADPTELQAAMMLVDTDEKIDVIAPNGEPRQYTSDELTELLNAEMVKRNELLLRYKTAYNKIKNAKKVETVHNTGL